MRAAVVFLDWLAAQHRTLAACRQADPQRWLSGTEATHRQQAGHFIGWAAKQHLTDLVFPATRWQGPTRPMDDQARWGGPLAVSSTTTPSTRGTVSPASSSFSTPRKPPRSAG